MKITIVGSGSIGAGLARAWASKGHELLFATRDPFDPSLAPLLQETGANARTIAESVASADVVVLALPFAAVPSVAQVLPDWRGKIVIDCTNAIGPGPTLLYGHTNSGAEVNARLFPGAHLVKSFNAQGAENLAQPSYGGVAASNFFCGDNVAAKATVQGLIEDVGLEAIDVGGLAAARFLEPMTLLWFAASRASGTRQVAFKLLRP